jgi:hypothetical protein
MHFTYIFIKSSESTQLRALSPENGNESKKAQLKDWVFFMRCYAPLPVCVPPDYNGAARGPR